MKQTVIMGLIVAIGALSGCKEETAAPAAPARAPEAAKPTAPTPAPSMAPAAAAAPVAAAPAAGGDIGVKECDDYVAKWNDCYKDPTIRAAAQPGLDAMKKSWAMMAANASTKPALAAGCKMALDKFPTASCK